MSDLTAWVAVLTAAAGVDDDHVGIVLDALDRIAPAERGAPRRLAPSAVEVPFVHAVPAVPVVGGIDVNIVPAEGRAKRLLIADMDSTIITVECIDELADYAGVKPQVAEITEAAMRGDLDFEGALDARVRLLEGLPVEVLETCFAERVRLTEGAQALVAGMNAAGAMTALVSGGFTFFTERVAALTGFRHNRANTLEIADGVLTGTVARPILGQAAKAQALAELTARMGIDPAQAVAIGDGANDVAMVRAAGLGVAYRAKPALRAAADVALDHSDLRAVLALQGLPVPA